jgi:hypothetical protein
MRAAIAFIAIACLSCESADAPDRPTAPPQPPTPRKPAVSAVAAPAPLFFPGLPWDVTPGDGMKALDRAHLAPQYGENRAYFMSDDNIPVHTNEPVIGFTPEPGWRGEARFGPDEKLDAVSLSPIAETLPPADVARVLARLEKQHGPPTDHVAWPAGGGHSDIWKHTSGQLTAAIGDNGTLHVVYAHAP